MLINEHSSIWTSKIVLVPYNKEHVPQYHGWMENAEIRAATASEQLTLDEEYSMQASWRNDSDKLTFISCQVDESNGASESITPVGDVNLFIVINEEEDGQLSLVGEIELMIAEKQNQRRGFGRAAVLVFLKYVLSHQQAVLAEYFSSPRQVEVTNSFSYLRVKIQEENHGSIGLFESMGFQKTSSTANYFGEFELRSQAMTLEFAEQLLLEKGIDEYAEKNYPSGDRQSTT